MRMQFKQPYKIVSLLVLISCFLWNCADQKQEPKAPVISKKIAVPNRPDPKKNSAETHSAASVDTPAAKDTNEKDVNLAKRIYDPKERINPFTPLFRTDEKKVVADQKINKKSRKRKPQTPLERISLNQLKLAAIIRATSGNRALVEENSGKGYIIKNGTYIGLNSGIVTQINANSVIVEEELENLMGELILQNTEIKLQKPAGE